MKIFVSILNNVIGAEIGEKIFFLPMSQNFTYLEYTFGENNLIFVFEENGLCATALIGKNFED